jgi:hypothetical protein
MGLITSLLRALKFPLKLLFRRKRGKRSELEEKQRKYVRNFSPTHYSWQKSIGRDKRKKGKKRKFSKKG